MLAEHNLFRMKRRTDLRYYANSLNRLVGVFGVLLMAKTGSAQETPTPSPAPAGGASTAAPVAAQERAVSITRVVGEAGGKIVTSREVRINEAVGLTLANVTGAKKITAATEAGFPQIVLRVLDEWTVFLEAGEIGTKPADKNEIARLAKAVADSWRGSGEWERLEPSAQEVREIVERKLVVQSLERLKSDASMVNVTDAEALQYYKKNRLRFGNMPFENFKDNIKAALVKSQTERRILEWRSVLRRKYRVRNFVGA